MRRWALPRTRVKVVVPPVKCQGIKSKLVPFIAGNISWDGEGRWIEPFLGSGVVLFSVQPQRAFVSDINPHLIAVYSDIQRGAVTPASVKQFLTEEGGRLQQKGKEHYYEVRERFNAAPNSHDFLFLTRSCFNGLMRFNGKGSFNVPFCHKPDRFRPAYVTKIVNQVRAVWQLMRDRDWQFSTLGWKACLRNVQDGDFVYLDPPYIGRSTDYYNRWTEEDAIQLARTVQTLPCGFAMSMWLENRYRRNSYIDDYWSGAVIRTTDHFYHIGSTEDLRNSMTEALLIRPGFEAQPMAPESKPVRARSNALALELR